MTSSTLLYICSTATIATGLVAGVFLAFSDFVMKSLSSIQYLGGIRSMQQINREVYSSVFLILLMAMTLLSFSLVVIAYVSLPSPALTWIASGAMLYIIGVFFVTMICNVPMNNALDVKEYNSDEASLYWKQYVSHWTTWNHVRTISSTASMVCFYIGSLLIS